jgi:hypothetical protein
MPQINHWTKELPEFGATLTLLQLLEEQAKANTLSVEYAARVKEIDIEIYDLTRKHWTDEEILTAREKFKQLEGND